jgi:hypothetical protein
MSCFARLDTSLGSQQTRNPKRLGQISSLGLDSHSNLKEWMLGLGIIVAGWFRSDFGL